MPKQGYTPGTIINKLREAEILISQGASMAAMTKRIGVSDSPIIAGEKSMAA